MRIGFRHLRRDERGMTFVFVGVGFMAFMAATTLAIDVGMFMTARSQAQNAADAGAHAGAVALVFNSYDDRSASGPAVQSALSAAGANKVIHADVSVTSADVTFPNGPGGVNNRVKATVYRTTDRNNAIPTLIGPLFGVPTVNIMATATAEASPANAATCVKPFMIPDKWQETQTPVWDPNDTFEMFDNMGNPLANPDIYVPADQPGYSGYNALDDLGTLLTIRAGTGNNINPSMYFSWKMPGDTGGDFYRDNIHNCNTSVVHWRDLIVLEPGNMVGPTNQGIDLLIAKDPGAYWDTGCNCVKGSAYGVSPRTVPIPLYDPVYYATGKANGRAADFRVANWLGFFVVDRQGNDVSGRITPVGGVLDSNAGPAPAGAIPKVIRLVE